MEEEVTDSIYEYMYPKTKKKEIMKRVAILCHL